MTSIFDPVTLNLLKFIHFIRKKQMVIASNTLSMQCMNAQRSKLNIHSVLKIAELMIHSCAPLKSINAALKNLLASTIASKQQSFYNKHLLSLFCIFCHGFPELLNQQYGESSNVPFFRCSSNKKPILFEMPK